jgi:hypothetical protein
MPGLLSPAFLAGLLALAIPILVHLRLREKRVSVPFPSLMFVRRIPHKSSRRRTLQNLLLFAARSLALILLCFAFARPFFQSRTAAASGRAGVLGRVVALDVSASMRYEGVFPRALAAAESALREATPEDAVGLLLFADGVQGVAPPSTDHERALSALRKAAPGVRATRFAPALRLAADWLAALKVDRREIVLVTDGQTRALPGASEIALPARTTVAVRSVGASAADNTAVAEVAVESIEEADRTYGIVTARLIHQGESERKADVSLEVAGRVVERRAVTLAANGASSITFNRAPVPAGASKGRVILEGDGLEADNAFHFALGAESSIKVLLLDESPFVMRALEIGSQPSFDLLRRTTFAAGDLRGRSLVVLGPRALTGIGAAAADALARFVREGGGLLATGPLTGLRGEAAQLLPVSWGDTVSRLGDRGASLGFVDVDHPALAAFKQARGSDFSRARFLQYRRLTPAQGSSPGLRVLARFDDGREALVEATFGEGRVLGFTSALDGVMSDLPLQPLFLPLVHELARYASAHRDVPAFHRVGEAVDLSDAAGGVIDRVVTLQTPAGRTEKVAENLSGIELTDLGFFQANRASGASTLMAANLDTAESDLTFFDGSELEAALRPRENASSAAETTALAPTAESQSWGWRALLVALVLNLVLEAILANTRGQKAVT